MHLVQQPIERLAVPPKTDVQGRSKGGGGSLQVADHDACQQPTLNARDLRPRKLRRATNVFLSPALSHAERAVLAA
ncbi:MAG TPA: hypothetical protein VFV72_10865 [Candidatus Limnocylindrales bacterium]|nr:hypothetical protein [Candidatus Limnocylindrales bacterium]